MDPPYRKDGISPMRALLKIVKNPGMGKVMAHGIYLYIHPGCIGALPNLNPNLCVSTADSFVWEHGRTACVDITWMPDCQPPATQIS